MRNHHLLPLLLLALPCLSSQAGADDNMAGMKMDNTTASQALSPSSQAYMSAMQGMHEQMTEGLKASDPDIAFAQGMIPHHQGAIAMAETELRYGKDPKMRALAQNVIRAQKAEIAAMQAWLKAHPQAAH